MIDIQPLDACLSLILCLELDFKLAGVQQLVQIWKKISDALPPLTSATLEQTPSF